MMSPNKPAVDMDQNKKAGLVAAYALKDCSVRQPTRSPGRPRTRTSSHYAALRDEYGSMKLWFEEVFARAPKSDAELLRAHLAAELTRQGLEPGQGALL